MGRFIKSVIDPGEISRPRPQHRLPNVLSKEEVKRILDSVINEKHRVMLSLVYGCGLRRSEVLELFPPDVDRDRKLLQIRQSKGFKDRFVPLSDKLVQMVDQYLLEAVTDLRYIQALLGHKSSRTTEIYTHVTTQSIQKIRSPFDDL